MRSVPGAAEGCKMPGKCACKKVFGINCGRQPARTNVFCGKCHANFFFGLDPETQLPRHLCYKTGKKLSEEEAVEYRLKLAAEAERARIRQEARAKGQQFDARRYNGHRRRSSPFSPTPALRGGEGALRIRPFGQGASEPRSPF